jgi:hypothetical protein
MAQGHNKEKKRVRHAFTYATSTILILYCLFPPLMIVGGMVAWYIVGTGPYKNV